MAEEIKVLGVVLDRRLTSESHVTVVARACNYHAHPAFTDGRAGSDDGMQTHHTVSAGLLQHCVAWSSSR